MKTFMRRVCMLLLFVSSLFCSNVYSNPSLVADINQKPTDGTGRYTDHSLPSDFFVYKSKLYFSANDGINGAELWSYDGSNPPVMEANINPVLTNGSQPHDFIEFKGNLYFLASDGSSNCLYAYDGINQPSLIYDGGRNSIDDFVIMGDNLYLFIRHETSSTYQILKIDENYSLSLVSDTISFRKYPKVTVVGTTMYFVGSEGVYEKPPLWSYDGVNPPSTVSGVKMEYDTGYNLMHFGSQLIFMANYNGKSGLWSLKGSTMTQLRGKAEDEDWYYDHLDGSNVIYKDKLYFAMVADEGQDLWVYDGVNPPSLVFDIHPEPYNLGDEESCNSGCTDLGGLIVLNSKLYFVATDDTYYDALWTFDGQNTPEVVFDDEGQVMKISKTSIVFGSKLFFSKNYYDTTFYGEELWVYDPNKTPQPPFISNTAVNSSMLNLLLKTHQ